LLERLDRIVLDNGGGLYLAKDSRAPAATFGSGYPMLSSFREIRSWYGLDRRFCSFQSERLGL
jgi:decaprenylphospho-beta-D-ribofuranose 2-oxidase